MQIFRGYWMVNWFKEQFGHHEQSRALAEDVAPEQLFDELVNAVPPGSMGLMLQPYWTPGIKVPGPEAKGAIIGFGDVHTRAHVYRAILEGLAYALREGKERIEKRSGVPITQLRVSGGGSQSDAAMQLTADIFGLPTARPHVYETSALGAAIDAAVGLGLYPDFASAIAAHDAGGQGVRADRGQPGDVRPHVPPGLPQDVCAAAADVPRRSPRSPAIPKASLDRVTERLEVLPRSAPPWLIVSTRLRPASLAAYIMRSAATKNCSMRSNWVGTMLATPMLTVSHWLVWRTQVRQLHGLDAGAIARLLPAIPPLDGRIRSSPASAATARLRRPGRSL